MEEIVYQSVRLACAGYLLYKVWQAKGQVRKVCDLLYGNAPSRKRKNMRETAPAVPPVDESGADIMGSTRFVYLDENAGKTVAPFMSLPLETDFIGEEKDTEEEEVECNLPLEEMRLLKEEQEELDKTVPAVEAVTQAITQADLENMGDVLFGVGDANRDEGKSQRAALTLHAIRETEMYAVIESQVENKEFLTELMDRYLDEDGNPRPHKFSQKTDVSDRDWRELL